MKINYQNLTSKKVEVKYVFSSKLLLCSGDFFFIVLSFNITNIGFFTNINYNDNKNLNYDCYLYQTLVYANINCYLSTLKWIGAQAYVLFSGSNFYKKTYLT